MKKAEIIQRIDDGANYYLRLLGDARHMEFIEHEHYSLIRPKTGEKGLTILFQVRITQLPEEELAGIIKEIKDMKMHTWWGLGLPENVLDVIWGTDRLPTPLEPNEEEAAMALLPQERPTYPPADQAISIKKVGTPEDFKLWADIVNDGLHNGYPLIHPENHSHLSETGKMPCYIGYYEGIPAAGAASMTNGYAASLEFVATLPGYRRKGLARAVCAAAIDEAFEKGAEIMTLRAEGDAKKLYTALGFRIYPC
ncbi:GNAT family N-acetyltransferase [Gorillibacterium massiliense]|uniref:GNAT family N-acetyltransferase n=1 Tax=Gorillibacterium massiliense TaxID=1280390 RepID=UPI0004B5DBD3|nr:GNAT family N-acetyltransferase [Gorillibacterium massiliense]